MKPPLALAKPVASDTDSPKVEQPIALSVRHDHKVSLIALSSHGRSGYSAWNISSVTQKLSFDRIPLADHTAYQPVQMDVRFSVPKVCGP
jgi:hypothetical protein